VAVKLKGFEKKDNLSQDSALILQCKKNLRKMLMNMGTSV